jgi:hypothetical protein
MTAFTTAAMQSPADVTNAALVRIGYRLRVGSLFDGSLAAKKALDIYAQTRDELLRQNDWYFAEGNVILTLQKQAPAGGYVPPTIWNPATNPPLPWLYQYAYPQDALKIRAVKGQPLFIPSMDPNYNNFDTPNDNTLNPPAKVIVCNVANAVGVYTRQVTDPSNWDSDFGEALVAAYARRLIPGLGNPELLKIAAPDEMQQQQIAETTLG